MRFRCSSLSFWLGLFIAGYPPLTTLSTSRGNLGPFLLDYLFLKRLVQVESRITKQPEAFVLVLLSGALSPLIIATTGLASLFAIGVAPAEDVVQSFLIWWKADATGVVLVTPLLLELVNRSPRHECVTRSPEMALLVFALIASLAMVTTTIQGLSAFSQDIVSESLIFLYAFILTHTTTVAAPNTTQRRKSEGKLRQANQVLEVRVKMRTAQLESAKRQT